MRRLLSVAALVVLSSAGTAGPIADGHWLLAGVGATGEAAQMILKVETVDGKQTASLLYAPPPVVLPNAQAPARKPASPEIRNFRVQGNTVSFGVAQSGTVRTFVGTAGPDAKRILGSLGTEAAAARAVLTATDKESFTAAERLVRSPRPRTMPRPRNW
jgi:hypothetical protein